MWADHGCQPNGADGDADTLGHTRRSAFDVGDRVSPFRCGSNRCEFVGSGECAGPSGVDLNAAAEDDMLERTAFGGGAQDGDCCVVGELCGQCSVGAGIGLPDANMD